MDNTIKKNKFHELYLECKKLYGSNITSDEDEEQFTVMVQNYFLQEWQKNYLANKEMAN